MTEQSPETREEDDPGVYTFEAALTVEDYYDEEGDEDDAFEECRHDGPAAVEQAQEHAREAIADDARFAELTFCCADFVEFDSRNISHAGAYFEVEIHGPEDLIAKIREFVEMP